MDAAKSDTNDLRIDRGNLRDRRARSEMRFQAGRFVVHRDRWDFVNCGLALRILETESGNAGQTGWLQSNSTIISPTKKYR
jgi:hypothetical protein